MSDPKRPDPKRRAKASRPGRAGVKLRVGPRRTPPVGRGLTRSPGQFRSVLQPIKRSIAAAAEHRSDLRVGFTARRAVILATMVCVLTLTIAGPVRTFFAQSAEMKQQTALEAALRQQIADLQQQKASLADPARIKAQARQRLGFVMPGEIPYQVQLPPTAEAREQLGGEPEPVLSDDPWYAALWHTIADTPHGPQQAPIAPTPVAPGD